MRWRKTGKGGLFWEKVSPPDPSDLTFRPDRSCRWWVCDAGLGGGGFGLERWWVFKKGRGEVRRRMGAVESHFPPQVLDSYNVIWLAT